MRRMVVTSEGEMRAPSIKGAPRQMPMRQHLGVPRSPVKGGMSSDTAPHKTDLQHFDSKHGFPSSFGMTGLE